MRGHSFIKVLLKVSILVFTVATRSMPFAPRWVSIIHPIVDCNAEIFSDLILSMNNFSLSVSDILSTLEN